MQVNRLSFGFQEELKEVSNFNTARSETLFDQEKFGATEDGEELDFSTLNTDDLNITEDQIATLFSMFQDEVIAVFGNNLPFMKQPQNNSDDSSNNDDDSSPVTGNEPQQTAQGSGPIMYTA